MSGPEIHFPSEEEELKAAEDAFVAMREARLMARNAALRARVAFPRLVEVMRHKTGQSYKLRALLYSLWNGLPVSLNNELLGLDRQIREDVCAVMNGFGWDGDAAVPAFFYDAIRDAVKKVGLWDWFIQANKEELR